MDYAPLQSWVSEGLVKTQAIFQRGESALTEYDPVHAGNIVTGEVDITDAGQLGRANLPSLHAQTNVRDPHVNDTLPPSDTVTESLPRFMRWLGLRGGQYNPTLFTDVDSYTTDYLATAGVAQQPFGMAGAGKFEGDVDEHGPISIEELEAAKGVRQPLPVRQRSLLRKLLFLPEKTIDPGTNRDERVIPQTGQDEKDKYPLTDAAVSVTNAITMPDVRRTFDQPRDAPASIPRDETGRPVYSKAGYTLTPTVLEGSVHEIQTAHAYPSFSAVTEYPVGSPVERVRAGVQYDYRSTRPAVMPHWFDFRPFDKWADDHNFAFKGQIRPRLISRPVMTSAEPRSDDRWAAGRRYAAPAAGMNPVAVLPNVDRQPPQSWDSQLYLETQQNVDARAASWRLG
jgi:hypothetical protein